MVEVASLDDVPLREVWPDEARDFTPWLAEHPDHLGKALAMDLELVDAEVAVGPFSADVVLRDANTGHLVVVENLLETTDHDHLGKLITYAAGLEAHWAVLVARAFRPEHRSALNWLNSLSGEGSGFFGVEVHVLDGEPAYEALQAQRAEIEAACDLELQWEPLENARASRVATYLDPVDPADRPSWPEYRAWAIETLGDLRRAFSDPIRNLP